MQPPFTLIHLWPEIRWPAEENREERLGLIEVRDRKIEHGTGELEIHRPTVAERPARRQSAASGAGAGRSASSAVAGAAGSRATGVGARRVGLSRERLRDWAGRLVGNVAKERDSRRGGRPGGAGRPLAVRRYGAQGVLTTQLTSSGHRAVASNGWEPPLLAM